jgi:acyl-ACP thioesterase
MPQRASAEIVPLPARGRVYDRDAVAGLADAAPSGRVRLDAIAGWLQDVAYADVEDAGLVAEASWVVRRSRMVVGRFPSFADRVRLRTFCSGLGRMWAERRTTLEIDGEAAVEAVAVWIHLDPQSLRPVPFSEREFAVYEESAGGREIKARLRHPAPGPDAERSEWTFRAADMDIAGHVNNAAYWQVLEERLLAGPDPSRMDAEIEFRSPAQAGPVEVLTEGERLWIGAPGDGDLHASLVSSDA